MLTPAELELILLAVDGECTPEQLDSLRELLAHSTEANTVYQQLNSHRISISQLQVPIPISLVDRVLDRLPTPRRARVGLARRRDWLPYFSALCLFLTVASGAFWFTFTSGESRTLRTTSPNAMRSPQIKPTLPALDFRGHAPSGMVIAEVSEQAPVPRQSFPVASPTHNTEPTLELAPLPRHPSINVVASPPVTEVLPLASVDLRLPWLVESPDLFKPEIVAKLRQELSRSSAFRLDLHSNDVAKAVEMLQSAGQGVPIKFTPEPSVSERLQKKQLSSIAIYVDTLTSEEIVAWLMPCLRPTGPSNGQPSLFHALHLIPATPQDAAEVRLLLGTDTAFLKRQPIQAPSSPKPISSGTIDQLTNALRGNSAEEHQAIVLAHSPLSYRTSPSQSKTIKTFLETRGERRAKSVPILIIIR